MKRNKRAHVLLFLFQILTQNQLEGQIVCSPPFTYH